MSQSLFVYYFLLLLIFHILADLLAQRICFCFPFNCVGKSLLFGITTPFDLTQLSLLDLSTLKENQLTSLNKDLLDQLLMDARLQ